MIPHLLLALTLLSSANAKFHSLAIGAYPPASRVTVTTREINAYIQAEMPYFIGPGVRNGRVEIATGNIARGRLDIDFLKVRQAHGEPPGWLLSKLLEGERPVAITARITSGHGHVRVDLLRVEISGVVAEGRTLDFLIANFVLPTFPDIMIGKDVPMGYNIDRLEIRPGAVTVVLSGKR
jgi:hypothetical protein